MSPCPSTIYLPAALVRKLLDALDPCFSCLLTHSIPTVGWTFTKVSCVWSAFSLLNLPLHLSPSEFTAQISATARKPLCGFKLCLTLFSKITGQNCHSPSPQNCHLKKAWTPRDIWSLQIWQFQLHLFSHPSNHPLLEPHGITSHTCSFLYLLVHFYAFTSPILVFKSEI